MVDELARKCEGVRNAVLVDVRSVTSAQAVELRAEMRKEKVRFSVVKNSVARHAFEKAGWRDLAAHLSGMNAVAYGPDPVAIAKRIKSFQEKAGSLKVRAAVVEGKAIPPAQIDVLSKLPSREQLLGMLVGTMAAPASSFVRVLNAIPSQFVRALAAVREKEAGAQKTS